MSKYLFAAAAWALAGAAAAQTVPAEAWVGPALATTGAVRSRADVNAELRRFLATPQATQDAWFGARADAGVAVGAATRAQVAADFALFQQAGLDGYQTGETFDAFSAEARRRVALYQRLRQGAEQQQASVTRPLTRPLDNFETSSTQP